MIYKIEKITLIREKEERHTSWSFSPEHETKDLEKYRESIQKKYAATRVHLNYEER